MNIYSKCHPDNSVIVFFFFFKINWPLVLCKDTAGSSANAVTLPGIVIVNFLFPPPLIANTSTDSSFCALVSAVAQIRTQFTNKHFMCVDYCQLHFGIHFVI